MGRIKNVQEIMEITKSHQASPDKMACKIIIRKIDRALRFRAENRHVDASIQIPSILVSTPEYSRENVTYKLFEHYNGMGFKCCRDVDGDQFKLRISWEVEEEESDEESDSEDEVEALENPIEPHHKEKPLEKKTIVIGKKETVKDRLSKLS